MGAAAGFSSALLLSAVFPGVDWAVFPVVVWADFAGVAADIGFWVLFLSFGCVLFCGTTCLIVFGFKKN